MKVLVIGATGVIVNLVRHAVEHVCDGGSITLTSGKIPEATAGSAGGARGLRLNAVSPGWVRESLARLRLDTAGGTPVSDVARAYVEAVEGTAQGRTIVPAVVDAREHPARP